MKLSRIALATMLVAAPLAAANAGVTVTHYCLVTLSKTANTTMAVKMVT